MNEIHQSSSCDYFSRPLNGYTTQPVFKDHLWEKNNLVFDHRWSLITGLFMQKMSKLGIKSVVAIDRQLLKKNDIQHRFDCTYIGFCLGFLSIINCVCSKTFERFEGFVNNLQQVLTILRQCADTYFYQLSLRSRSRLKIKGHMTVFLDGGIPYEPVEGF